MTSLNSGGSTISSVAAHLTTCLETMAAVEKQPANHVLQGKTSMWYTAFISGFEFGSLFLISFWFVSYAWKRTMVVTEVRQAEAVKVTAAPAPFIPEPQISVQKEPDNKTIRILKTFGIRQLKTVASHLIGTPHSIGQYGQLNKPKLLQALIDRLDSVAQLDLDQIARTAGTAAKTKKSGKTRTKSR